MGVAATNPQNAFTLDIHSDKNKVKLHLNCALIKKVLQDNKLNTVERRKARRQVSILALFSAFLYYIHDDIYLIHCRLPSANNTCCPCKVKSE